MVRVNEKRIREAAAKLQTPGVNLTISSGGRSASVEDPRDICMSIAQLVELAWKDDDGLEKWPFNDAGEPIEYQEAKVAAMIGRQLIQGIQRFAFLGDFTIGYLYRNKDPWESQGRTVYGKFFKVPPREAHYTGHDFEMVLNWNIWQQMTPWQKVALVYHELRHGDTNDQDKPAIRGHQWEGFFDELELFGLGTYADWTRLGRATQAGDQVSVQYHLSFPEEHSL